jgi:two-component system response regulator BaeR
VLIKKVLVVDDDPQFSDYIKSLLAEDFAVSCAHDKKSSLDVLARESFDLCILDYRLPDGTGHDVVREMRSLSIETPVFMVTGYADKDLVINSLNMGIHQFMEKPFENEVFKKSIHLVLNKAKSKHDIRLDTEQRCAFCGDERVELTSIEYRILEILLSNKNKQVSRDVLQKEIWGQSLISKHTLDTHIYNLKKKSERIKKMIRVVHGSGFIFDAH